MTIARVMVAVDDTPAALAAAHVAVDLAYALAASVRFVHVLADGEVARHFAGSHHDGTLRERRVEGATSLLTHVVALARQEHVPADTAQLQGDPATAILDQATAWQASLLVLGRSRSHKAGQSYIGATSRQVLEFSEVPVLIVPFTGG